MNPLKQARRELGLTGAQAADCLGITERHLFRMEREVRPLYAATKEALIDLYGEAVVADYEAAGGWVRCTFGGKAS